MITLMPDQNGDRLQGRCLDMYQGRLFWGFPKSCKYKMKACFRNYFTFILYRPYIYILLFPHCQEFMIDNQHAIKKKIFCFFVFHLRLWKRSVVALLLKLKLCLNRKSMAAFLAFRCLPQSSKFVSRIHGTEKKFNVESLILVNKNSHLNRYHKVLPLAFPS